MIATGDHVRILFKRQLVRDLIIDTTRRYQPLGRASSGRRRLPRVVSAKS